VAPARGRYKLKLLHHVLGRDRADCEYSQPYAGAQPNAMTTIIDSQVGSSPAPVVLVLRVRNA